MTVGLNELSEKDRQAVVERWIELTLATYQSKATAFFMREGDRFANPVGRAVRVGLRGVGECLLGEMNAEEICRQLEEVVKIRAVQDFTPGAAVSFVFLFKDAVREKLAGVLDESRFFGVREELERRVDQAALFAFDIFVRCREQVYELRVNEVKRSVAALVERFQDDDETGGKSNGDGAGGGGGIKIKSDGGAREA